MNAGCYGSETKDVLVEAHALTRSGERLTLSNADLDYSYRKSARAAAEPLIFTGGLFQGRPDEPAAIEARMAEITARREQTQPIREKTAARPSRTRPAIPPGSWWTRPAGVAKPYGGAMFSPLHANFLINTGEATAADLEGLGEAVRADVKARLGVDLDWEIKRIGRP